MSVPDKDCDILEITMKFKVPKIISKSFLEDFKKRIHKYLAKHAVTVYAVDSKTYDCKDN